MIKQEKRITKTKELLKKRINAKIFEFKLFNEFLKLIRLLSKDFPDFNIVIKPHPTEDPNDWVKSIKKYRNVYVDSQFELTPYIAAAELVIFNLSISGIQSVMMNKKTICYSTLKQNDSLRSFPNKFGIVCNNYNKLKKNINKNSKNNFNINLKEMKKRIYISRKYSSDVIIDDLIKNFGFNKKSKKKKI